MGEVISAGAGVDRVKDDIFTSFTNANARGGEIAAAAAARLGPSVAAIETAALILDAATKAEVAAWAPVLAADAVADTTIGATRDAMWNALGRPKQHAQMDHVYPGGIGTYTAGDPCGQPVLMEVLVARIKSAAAPQWTDALRSTWAASVDAARVPLAAAVDAHKPADAALTVAEAGFRAAVRAAHGRLVIFKRDLKNLGLTEAQIHEIVPDRSARSGGKNGDGKAPPVEPPKPPTP
jgi:hypothetical protein